MSHGIYYSQQNLIFFISRSLKSYFLVLFSQIPTNVVNPMSSLASGVALTMILSRFADRMCYI